MAPNNFRSSEPTSVIEKALYCPVFSIISPTTEFCLRRWGATTAAAVQVIPKQTAVRRQEPKYSPDVLLLAEGLSEIFPTTPVDYLRYCCLDLVGNEAIQERLTLELLETGVPKSP